MIRILLFFTLIVSMEANALACSCIPPPTDPAQRRLLARESARGAVALVEVELVTPYSEQARGERLRVRRTLAGRAPASFWVPNTYRPSSAGCGMEFSAGSSGLVLLYPEKNGYRLSNLCTNSMLADAPFREAVIAQMRRRR